MSDASLDRLPPYSPDAERGILGSILISNNGAIAEAEARLGREGEPFYDLRHAVIYRVLIALNDRRMPMGLICLRQCLIDMHQLDEVGGDAYILTLPDATPSPANLPYFIGIVLEKYSCRRIIRACTNAVSRVYDDSEPTKALTDLQVELATFKLECRDRTEEHWTLPDLTGFDPKHDPNALIGLHNGMVTRYLCKGYGAFQIGLSGIGKSTLDIQRDLLWSCGKAFLGMAPVRPLRILAVQSENDIGDCSETVQGILDSLDLTTTEMDLVRENFKIVRCRGRTGKNFCLWLRDKIYEWRAAIASADPLLRFAGIDVSKQDQCTRFLNEYLDPVLAETEAAIYGTHHTGKPKPKADTKHWTIYDYAYAGLGSSELVNWARAISILSPAKDGYFELLLAKRGQRAWATHPNGEFSTSLWLKHAEERIFWVQVDPPEFTVQEREVKKANPGRPSKSNEIAWSTAVHDFIETIPAVGEGKNSIARRMVAWAATQKSDISVSTAKRAVEAMVANAKLVKTVVIDADGAQSECYLKGPNF